MKVKVLTNQASLRFGDIGYCSMVPYDRYTPDIDIFKVRVCGKEYELKSIDFEIIGEDDDAFEAKINMREQARLVERKIELAEILKTSCCTIFHFTDKELRRCRIFDANGQLVNMSFSERTLLAKFIHEYCSECFLPYVEEIVSTNNQNVCFFNNLKHYAGSKFIPKDDLWYFLTNLVKKEAEEELEE